jgi:hypothetical protein
MSTRGVEDGRRVRLTNSPPSVSRLSKNMGASTCHPNETPRSVTDICLPFFNNELKTKVLRNSTSVSIFLFILDSFHLFVLLNIILNI